MRVAQVILDIPTTALDQAYTYALPEVAEAGDFPIEVGCAVLVPFGARDAIGFVVSIDEVPDDFGAVETLFVDDHVCSLKCITRALSSPFFSGVGARCAQWMSARYVAPLSVCVRLFTPPGAVPKMVHTRGFWELKPADVGEVDDRWVVPGAAFGVFQPRENAVKQRAVLDVLAHGEIRVSELTAEYGSVSAALRALEKHGAVVVEHRRRMRGAGYVGAPAGAGGAAGKGAGKGAGGEGAGASAAVSHPTAPRHTLTPDQARALEVIRARQTQGGGTVLVDGVTGSGKTEVYLRAIEDVLAQGKTALVLVPEISLTPQTVARFRGRFGEVVAVLHSGMSAGERFDQWDFIRRGRARVVVGARSALFAPLVDIGIIVIDEEHETSYKQDSTPRYVTRDVAEWLRAEYACTLVLGSATPSLEALHRATQDPTWTCTTLPTRANGRALPPVDVVDRGAEFRGGARSAVFSPTLASALATALAKGEKCILFLNQRGFSKSMLCRDCGYIPECQACSCSLTYHQAGYAGPHLMCHHCGYEAPVPAACPACGSPYLRMFGTGTQQVEEHLRALLATLPAPAATATVVRMDADTTRTKGAHQRLLEQFATPGAAVLLGTQMIAKGLDFKQVTLVGVISADNMLAIPDFRSAERTFDLIQQVAGRAGRAELPGRVIVQTYRPAEPAIRGAATYNREAFLADELPKRRMFGYPPFARLSNIVFRGSVEAQVQAAAAQARDLLAQACAQLGAEGNANLSSGAWNISEATPCVMGKLQGKYRFHVVLKTAPAFNVSAACTALARAVKLPADVQMSVDIDAVDLL